MVYLVPVLVGVVCGLQKNPLMKLLKPLFPSNVATTKPIMSTSPTAFIKMVIMTAFPRNWDDMNKGNRNAK